MWTALLITTALLAQSDQVNPSHQSEVELGNRGVYAFGSYGLDLRRLQETRYAGPGPVVDCSDDQAFCVRGEIFNFSIPRNCRLIENSEHWTFGGISMKSIRDVTDSGYNFPVYYLVNDRTNVAYEYHIGQGIVAVYFDPDGRIDFRTIAETGKLLEWRRDNAFNGRASAMFNFVTTLDPLARCDQDAWRPAPH